MKLATLKNNTRDGQLVVVDRSLARMVAVGDIAPTLQAALDNWPRVYPRLEAVYRKLSQQTIAGLPFDTGQVMAPLPRAYQWADGSAYLNHVRLVRQARGGEMPEDFWHDPLMYQGGSDGFLGALDPIPLIDVNFGLDFEAEVCVVTTDVPMGASLTQASQAICLLMLVNDVSLRHLIPHELGKGFGFFQSKPASAFSPVAVTPDELGSAWDGKRVHLPLISHLNGKLFGRPNAGVEMHFDFPTLIAHAAKTRGLVAGSIIGSGTVSNSDETVGSSCIAEVRMKEIIKEGEAKTPFMQVHDRIRIEMLDKRGASILGAIDQQVVSYQPTKANP